MLAVGWSVGFSLCCWLYWLKCWLLVGVFVVGWSVGCLMECLLLVEVLVV